MLFSRVVVRFWSLLDLYVLRIRTEDFVRLLADENCVVPFCFFRLLVCGRDASVLCCSAGHHERHSLVLPFKLMVTTKEVFPSDLIRALRVSCPALRSLFAVEYKSGEKATTDWCRNLVVRWLSWPATAGLKLFLELLYSYSIQAKSSHLLYLLPVIYHIYISLDRKIDFCHIQRKVYIIMIIIIIAMVLVFFMQELPVVQKLIYVVHAGSFLDGSSRLHLADLDSFHGSRMYWNKLRPLCA